MAGHLRTWATAKTRDVHALYLAGRDPRVPWHARAVAACIAAYALSPIGLIPDFIPVLGQVDDLLIVPAGIVLAVALVPPAIMAELRARAASSREKPHSLNGAVAIIAVWAGLCVLFSWLAYRSLGA